MNKDLFLYKTRLVSFMLLLGYAWMHVKLTGVYTNANLEQLITFSAPLPYGQRLLLPGLAHVIQIILPFSAAELFFLLEWLFISLFFLSLHALMNAILEPKLGVENRLAQLLSWLFILLLPLMSVVNYRFTAGGESTFFYPSDSPSLFFTACGFLLCLKERWFWYMPLVFLATINRESSILLIALIPALHWQKGVLMMKPMVLAALTYLLTRFLVLLLLRDLPGGVVEWYFRASEHTLFEVNWYWLLNEQNMLFFMFCFAGLPLFWFAFYDYIPFVYRPLRYVAFFYFLGLLLVGNFTEVRIFNELLVLLYPPVCFALTSWISGKEPYLVLTKGVFYYLNRYIILILLALIMVFRHPLNSTVIWLSHFPESHTPNSYSKHKGRANMICDATSGGVSSIPTVKAATIT